MRHRLMHCESRTYYDLKIDAEAELKRIAREDDFLVFANFSGNHNPTHLGAYDGDGQKEAVAPGLRVGSLISAVLGNRLLAPETPFVHQGLDLVGQVCEGQETTVRVRVVEKLPERKARQTTEVIHDADGSAVVTGEAGGIAAGASKDSPNDNQPALPAPKQLVTTRGARKRGKAE